MNTSQPQCTHTNHIHYLYLFSHRSPSDTPEPVHRPTVIRIGSRDSLSSPRRDSPHNDTSRRYSYTSTSSGDSCEGRSVEGAISPMMEGGLRRPSPIIPSIRRSTHAGFGPIPHRSLQRITDEDIISSAWQRKTSSPQTFPRSGLGMAKTCSAGYILEKREQDEFSMINK